MGPTYYWKALHLPSDQYLLNHITGNVLHTNRIGSRWDHFIELEAILKKKGIKFVKGPLKVKFEKEDWELQEFKVSLHKQVRLTKPRLLSGKYIKKKIKALKDNGNRPKVVKT